MDYKFINTLIESVKKVFPGEELADGSIKTSRKLFVPSSFRVKQASYDLEKYTENYIKYTLVTELHECLKFNFIQLLKFSLKMYSLDELAETSDAIEVPITLDGTKLTSNLFHVSPGMKIIYCHTKETLTETFLMNHSNL